VNDLAVVSEAHVHGFSAEVLLAVDGQRLGDVEVLADSVVHPDVVALRVGLYEKTVTRNRQLPDDLPGVLGCFTGSVPIRGHHRFPDVRGRPDRAELRIDEVGALPGCGLLPVSTRPTSFLSKVSMMATLFFMFAATRKYRLVESQPPSCRNFSALIFVSL
jgi:hypothetical protein